MSTNNLVKIELTSNYVYIIGPVPQEVSRECTIPYNYWTLDWHTKRRTMKSRELKYIYYLTGRKGGAYFPAGWYDRIIQIYEDLGYEIEIVDKTNKPSTFFSLEVNNELPLLRDYQLALLTKAVKRGRGILEAPAGSGKTLVYTYLLAYYGLSSLIIVPSVNLLNQAYNDLVKAFGEGSVGKLGDSEWKEGLFTVATIQSLWSKMEQNLGEADSEFIYFLNSIQVVIVDECIPKTAKISLWGRKTVMLEELIKNNSFKEVLLTTWNEKLKKTEPKKIVNIVSKGFKKIYKLTVEDEVGNCRILRCSPEEKIYSESRYIKTDKLKVGDSVFTQKDYKLKEIMIKAKIVSIEIENLEEEVYDIEVEDNHNLIVDGVLVANCHHIKNAGYNPRNTYFKIVIFINAPFRFGATATPGKEGSLERLLLEGATGPLIGGIEASELVAQGHLVRPKIKMHIISISTRGYDWQKAYEANIVGNRERNMKIVELAREFASKKETVLISCNWVEKHGKVLKEMLGDEAEVMFGLTESDDRQDIMRRFESKDCYIIISTIMNEGVNIPSMDALILASAGKSYKQLIQRIGRVMRPSEGKKTATVIDFYDQDRGILEKHSKARLKVYQDEEAYDIELVQLPRFTEKKFEDFKL